MSDHDAAPSPAPVPDGEHWRARAVAAVLAALDGIRKEGGADDGAELTPTECFLVLSFTAKKIGDMLIEAERRRIEMIRPRADGPSPSDPR